MVLRTRRQLFGQHFLRDHTIADRLAQEAIRLAIKTNCRSLLEIGPGKGALTEPLVTTWKNSGSLPIEQLILAERDPRLVNFWQTHAKELQLPDGAELVFRDGDFLELADDQWLQKPPVMVASNLPYSAGTAILIKLARQVERVPAMVLMFQAEVAQRLRAEPDTKSWGSLSLWIQNYWDVTKLIAVPPSSFAPPPKVDSEVVVLVRRAEPRIAVFDDPKTEKLWDSLLKVAFAHRRKMLRSGLPKTGNWQIALEQAGLDGTKRAEALSWEEWKRFLNALRSLAST